MVADSDILADRFWVRIADFFGQQTATPFSDNGPFVANLIDTLAGGDALIGLRARGDFNHPFTLVNAMQPEAEAQFRQSEQTLQTHLDAVREAVADAAPGRCVRLDGAIGERFGGDHAGATGGDRCGAQGYRRYAAEAARGTV